GLVRAGGGIDLPDQGAIDLGGHAALGDVAVGADAHVQVAAVLAGGQRLGPVVVDRRGQVGDLHRRAAGAGLSVRVVELHQRVLVGDVQRVADQGQAIGCVEVFGENGPQFVGAVAV